LAYAYGSYLAFFWCAAKGSLVTLCLPSEKKSERNTGAKDERKYCKAQFDVLEGRTNV